MKYASGQHTIKAPDLYLLWQQAVRQGKEAHYIVKFKNGMTALVIVSKED